MYSEVRLKLVMKANKPNLKKEVGRGEVLVLDLRLKYFLTNQKLKTAGTSPARLMAIRAPKIWKLKRNKAKAMMVLVRGATRLMILSCLNLSLA